jgi:tetratricopeptide (TPR) repeat protein
MSPEPEKPQAADGVKEKSNDFAKVMKWVGSITAILSLAGALGGIVKVMSNRLETRRKIDTLLSSAELESKAMEYESSWQTLEQARQVKPDSAKVQAAEETLAMKWIEDIDRKGPETPSEEAVKLKPVLERGIILSKPGIKQADLLAHLGLCYRQELQDLRSRKDPEVEQYAKAVEEDPTNPYAQAQWGYSILDHEGDLGEAEKHFSAALASNREHAYVRELQMNALAGCHKEGCAEETVRVGSAMRQEHLALNYGNQEQIFYTYSVRLKPASATFMRFVNTVPPAEHIATFHWMFDSAHYGEGKGMEQSLLLATLTEGAGQGNEALALYREVLAKCGPRHDSICTDANAGVKRLSGNLGKAK